LRRVSNARSSDCAAASPQAIGPLRTNGDKRRQRGRRYGACAYTVSTVKTFQSKRQLCSAVGRAQRRPGCKCGFAATARGLQEHEQWNGWCACWRGDRAKEGKTCCIVRACDTVEQIPALSSAQLVVGRLVDLHKHLLPRPLFKNPMSLKPEMGVQWGVRRLLGMRLGREMAGCFQNGRLIVEACRKVSGNPHQSRLPGYLGCCKGSVCTHSTKFTAINPPPCKLSLFQVRRWVPAR